MGRTACHLCPRRFATPRALAGHMRSHAMAARAALQSAPPPQISSASSASTSPTAPQPYGLREKPKMSYRSLAADEEYYESGSEMSSSPENRRRRSTPEWLSSEGSDLTTEENVAISLIKLSQDSWSRSGPVAYGSHHGDPDHQAKRTRFQCDVCKRVFRSYQALGGHRASNKQGKGGCLQTAAAAAAAEASRRRHGNSTVGASETATGLIDLNMPAPAEDEISAIVGDRAAGFW